MFFFHPKKSKPIAQIRRQHQCLGNKFNYLTDGQL